MHSDRKQGANIAVRLDRLGVSPREETTEFNSVNHPIVAGLRDQRSPSSSRSVAGFLCPPVACFAILRITRCKRGGARVTEYRCRPSGGPTRLPNGRGDASFSHDKPLHTVHDVEDLTLLYRDLSSLENPASREQRLLLSLHGQRLPLQDCCAR